MEAAQHIAGRAAFPHWGAPQAPNLGPIQRAPWQDDRGPPTEAALLFRKQFLDLRLIALSHLSQNDLGLLVVDRVRKSEAAVPLLMERQDLVGPYVTIFGHAPLQRGREHGGLSAADATLESAIIDNGPGNPKFNLGHCSPLLLEMGMSKDRSAAWDIEMYQLAAVSADRG
jgi:hypothetical protein